MNAAATFGHHTEADTVIHHLDPRVRLVMAAAFAVVVVACKDFSVLGAALAGALALALAGRLPLASTMKRVLVMDAFVVAMLVMLPFTVPGEEWFRLGPLTATWDGLWRAVEIGLKANAIILCVLALAGTIETAVLGHALGKLRVPDKLILLFLFTVRYIEVLYREYHRLRLAMRARAFQPKSDMRTWRTYGHLLGMLLVRSLDRSERVMQAMKCRGFSGRFHLHYPMAMRTRDGVFAVGGSAAMAALLWWDKL